MAFRSVPSTRSQHHLPPGWLGKRLSISDCPGMLVIFEFRISMSAFRVMAIALCQELQARGIYVERGECELIIDAVVGRTQAVLHEAITAPPRLIVVQTKRESPPP